MLNWWLGKGMEGNHDHDDPEQEPPETPAPVFAARALKSALFGAPPIDDDAIYEVEQKPEQSARTKPEAQNTSPPRPAGILLTPGTATFRRKTVSFGHEVKEKKEERNAGVKGQGLSRSPGQWLSESNSSAGRVSRRTSLTEQLEGARQKKAIVIESEEVQASTNGSDMVAGLRGAAAKDVKPEQGASAERTNLELLHQTMSRDNNEGDATIDLNQPHSQSGKFWKSEYEDYHEQAMKEMTKLLNYKEMAKSFAKLKDVQAMNLAEKLKEEQRSVIAMENRIMELTARIAASATDGSDDESPALTKELAKQTALGIQYKRQVGEFQAALEAARTESSPTKSKEDKQDALLGAEQRNIEAQSELKKNRERTKEMNRLHQEVRTIRNSLWSSEEKSSKLEAENMQLSQRLMQASLNLQTQVEKHEKELKLAESQRNQKDEALRALQTEFDKFRESSISQRRELEQQMKKQQEENNEMRKEITSLRSSGLKNKELQDLATRNSTEYAKPCSKNSEYDNVRQGRTVREYDVKESTMPSQNAQEKMLPLRSKASSSDDRPSSQDSHLPVPTHAIARPSRATTKQTRSNTPSYSPIRPRSSHSALSEVVNNASADSVPPARSGPVQHTPAGPPNRFSNQLLELALDLPSPEKPSASYTTTSKIQQPSPRPSRFNFDVTSSPPKPVMVRNNHATGALVGQRSGNDLRRQYVGSMNLGAGLGSSRSGVESLDASGASGRVRKEVPPERAAAAKARLAEKERIRKMGGSGEREGEKNKENVRA